MKTEKLNINGQEYLKIGLEKVTQKENYFFVGKINASDLLKIFTVRPAKYDIDKNSALAKSFPSESDYYSHLVTQNEEAISDKDFQRHFDKNRVRNIERFLNDDQYSFFPNTIIANCDLVNDFESFGITQESTIDDFRQLGSEPAHLSFLFKEGDDFNLLVPFTNNSILVIDGQHRLKGLKRAEAHVSDNYELLVAFIIGFDRSVIAQQFYTINYEQKPVNKSLLYHLTGEFSTDLDELTFMHNTVKILNELDYSPFFKRIKMLGVNPPDASQEEKQLLSISQAFLIDALIRTISKSAISSLYQPIFLYYYLKDDLQIEIVRLLIKYFKAVDHLCQDWDNPQKSILSKGMGVGALIKVLHLIFPIIFVDEWKMQPEEIKNYSEEDFRRILKGLKNVDFSKDGEFGGVGSAGSINRIKEQIIEKLEFLSDDSFDKFQETFKKEGEYYEKFNTWLKSNSK